MTALGWDISSKSLVPIVLPVLKRKIRNSTLIIGLFFASFRIKDLRETNEGTDDKHAQKIILEKTVRVKEGVINFCRHYFSYSRLHNILMV